MPEETVSSLHEMSTKGKATLKKPTKINRHHQTGRGDHDLAIQQIDQDSQGGEQGAKNDQDEGADVTNGDLDPQIAGTPNEGEGDEFQPITSAQCDLLISDKNGETDLLYHKWGQ